MRTGPLTALGLTLALALSTTASAATLTLGLDIEFSGGVPPQGATPWITATFDDSSGDANTVRLTMTATNLVGNENVAGWYFNFDPALDSANLTITAFDESAAPTNNIFHTVDCCKADGDGFFDIQFDFPPPPGNFDSRFTTGETVTYDLVYTSAITASSFDFFSAPGDGQGSFRSAAHVQNTGRGNDSGWIGNVPEPSTGLLLGAGLLGLAAYRRRR